MIEKTFLNPATNKQWRIEIDGHTIRTCLNGGKVKEILCYSAFQVKSKAASAMMGQMRKGFVYQNPDAAVGQARCHRFIGKDNNGFMPLAAALTRDDFFLTRVAGDFEDEILYYFNGFDLSSFRIRMLFPLALMLYKSSRWMWNPSSRTVSAIPKAAFANRSSPARFPVNSNSFPSSWVAKERWAFGSNGRMGSCSSLN